MADSFGQTDIAPVSEPRRRTDPRGSYQSYPFTELARNLWVRKRSVKQGGLRPWRAILLRKKPGGARRKASRERNINEALAKPAP